MGNDKSPVISEKQYTYEGIYDIRATYDYIKNYLENTKHYDISERDLNEKNSKGEKEIKSLIEAELFYNDYYKIIIKFELDLKGKDIIVEDKKGNSIKLVKGTAKITLNSYIVKDYNKKIQKGPLATFLRKAYDSYISESELGEVIKTAAMDVGELLSRFKQQVNSTL